MNCWSHATQAAQASCCHCGKGLCPECAKFSDSGRSACIGSCQATLNEQEAFNQKVWKDHAAKAAQAQQLAGAAVNSNRLLGVFALVSAILFAVVAMREHNDKLVKFLTVMSIFLGLMGSAMLWLYRRPSKQ